MRRTVGKEVKVSFRDAHLIQKKSTILKRHFPTTARAGTGARTSSPARTALKSSR